MAPSAPLPEATTAPSIPDIENPEDLQPSNGHSSEQPERPPAAPVKQLVSILHSSKSTQTTTLGVPVAQGQGNDSGDKNADAEEPTNEEDGNQQVKRSVQWNDINGKELAQVWEFEASDSGDSDDDEDGESSQSCTCVIQ